MQSKWKVLKNIYLSGVGKSRFSVCMEKDMQDMIIAIALLIQGMSKCNCKPTFAHTCSTFLEIWKFLIKTSIHWQYKQAIALLDVFP